MWPNLELGIYLLRKLLFIMIMACIYSTSLWRNFICCYPVKLFVDWHDDKDNPKQNEDKKEEYKWKEILFYAAVYVWVMTDFFIRIFPILACARLRNNYLEFLAVMFCLTLWEFGMHYFMLRDEFKTPRNAMPFFWTLYFTVSYCLLSTMHLVYLLTNVIFDHLFIEHCVRLMIQAAFMITAMVIQYYDYGGVLGFFEKSIILFWICWLLNWVLSFGIKRGFKNFEEKFKITYSPLKVLKFESAETHIDSDDNHNQIEMSPQPALTISPHSTSSYQI